MTPNLTLNSTPKKDSRLHSMFYNMPSVHSSVQVNGCPVVPFKFVARKGTIKTRGCADVTYDFLNGSWQFFSV